MKANAEKEAVSTDDPQTEAEIMNEIREKYFDNCRNTGIDVAADDRKARIGFIII